MGCLVTCNDYRNPALLANMAKTVDHISGGRLILGLGVGWFEWEYQQYGYPYRSDRERLEALGLALPLIKERWLRESPPPLRNPIPILIGGEGERITLRFAAQHADIWNGFGPPERFQRKCAVLDRWCRELGRDPAGVERSVLTVATSAAQLDPLVEAGASHIITYLAEPWNFKTVERLVRWRDQRRERSPREEIKSR